MTAIIGVLLRGAWSYLAPALGPIVARWAPAILVWWPSFSVKSLLRGVCVLAFGCFVAWGTWRLVRSKPDPEPMVAVSVVEAQRYAAENAKLKAALEQAQATLRSRDLEADKADSEIETLRAEKEALRAQSSDPDAAVFSADDPWLRGKRR